MGGIPQQKQGWDEPQWNLSAAVGEAAASVEREGARPRGEAEGRGEGEFVPLSGFLPDQEEEVH